MGSKAENDSVVNPILAWLTETGGGGYKVHGNQLQRGGEPDIDGQYYSERLQRWIHLKIEGKYVWLERVYRKGVKVQYGWDYEYRIEGSEIGAS